LNKINLGSNPTNTFQLNNPIFAKLIQKTAMTESELNAATTL